MISQDSLPESLVPLCLDILRKLSSGERDLIRIVVEVIHELRDVDLNEDDFVCANIALVKTTTKFYDQQREKSEADVEDTPMPGKTPVRPRKLPTEMNEEERRKAEAIDIRCLDLCRGMLERVNSVRRIALVAILQLAHTFIQSFEENSTLEGILGELIIPAVRNHEVALRERGLICLGLCCLIARVQFYNLSHSCIISNVSFFFLLW